MRGGATPCIPSGGGKVRVTVSRVARTRRSAAHRLWSRGLPATVGAIIIAGTGAVSPAAARHVRTVYQSGSSPAFEAIVLDATTGQVLRSSNADVPTYPASLTKMMTLYLTF